MILSDNRLHRNYCFAFQMEKPITDIIKQYLFENGISLSYLASSLNIAQSNLSRTLKKNDISALLLLRISESLKHDFFQYFSRAVEKKIAPNRNISNDNDVNKLLKENLELYRKLEKERMEKEKLTKSNQTFPDKSKLKTKV